MAAALGDACAGRIRFVTGAGDEALGAVEDVAVAVLLGARAHGRGVAARLTLGQRVGERRLAVRDGREVALLELLGARQDHPGRPELVPHRDERGRRADPGDLLDEDAVRDLVRAGAAVGLGDVDRQQVRVLERLVDVPRVLALLVDLGRPRRDDVELLGHALMPT